MCLSMRERLYGELHHDVATSLHNLARLATAAGDYNTAKPLYTRALTIQQVHTHTVLCGRGCVRVCE